MGVDKRKIVKICPICGKDFTNRYLSCGYYLENKWSWKDHRKRDVCGYKCYSKDFEKHKSIPKRRSIRINGDGNKKN